jgi:DNA replication protein DnaC
MNHITTLKTQARQLRLSTLAANLELRLQEAESHQLPYPQFLELLLQDELNGRHGKAIARDTKAAAFREQRCLGDFDFSFNPSVPRAKVYELATCQFIGQARDVLLIGPPGVGKSHIAQSLGQEAIRRGRKVYYRSIFDLVRDLSFTANGSSQQNTMLNRYLKPELLIIDDMGMKALPQNGAELLLEIIVRRNGLRSTLMTSNRPIDEWGQLLGDLPAAGAILDRLLHQAEIIVIEGRSHRLAQGAARQAAAGANQSDAARPSRRCSTSPE